MSEEQLSASEGHVRKMTANGVEVKRYSEDELRRTVPGIRTRQDSDDAKLMSLPNISAGLFGTKCGRLAPEKLVGFYRDAFVRAGGKLMFNQNVKRLLAEPVESLGLDGEPFVWQRSRVAGIGLDDGREVRADTVVVAGGAWNNELTDPIGIDGHAKAKKRQLFTIPAGAAPALRDLLLAKGFNTSGTMPFMILPKSGLFLKAVRESDEFWIGCEDEINRPFMSYPDDDLEKYLAEPPYYEHNVHQILREYLPQFSGVRPARMWAGLYSYNTLDNMPYVFPEEGLIVVGGDSGSGVMKGDSLGRIVDAIYREGADAEAVLQGGVHYRASKLGFRNRDVEREEWVL
jgi:FAD-dependent oxidoreductase domain-containing protein 1